MKIRFVFSRLLPASALLLSTLFVSPALALEAGTQLQNATIRDANDKPATFPDFGKKVLAIFYNDPDKADQMDPMADVLKAANLDETVYRGIGVANMADTWLPNSVIRAIVRKKIEKDHATILTDPDRLLPKAWSLGDCNDKGVFVIVDKKGKAQYVKKGTMTKAEMDAALALVKKLMAE